MKTTQTKTTSLADLRNEAERQNIPNFSRMRKAELEAALSASTNTKGGRIDGTTQ